MSKSKPPIERRRLDRNSAELRTEGGPTGSKLVGYAAKFNVLSQDLGGFVEYIRPGPFKDSIAQLDVRGLVDHIPVMILGRNKAGTLRLEEDEIGLRFEVDLPDTQAGRDIAVSVNRGDVDGCSFSFIAVADQWKNDGGIEKRELIQVHLFDVGPVTFPAYSDTEVALRSLAAHRATQAAPITTPIRDSLRRWLTVYEVR